MQCQRLESRRQGRRSWSERYFNIESVGMRLNERTVRSTPDAQMFPLHEPCTWPTTTETHTATATANSNNVRQPIWNEMYLMGELRLKDGGPSLI